MGLVESDHPPLSSLGILRSTRQTGDLLAFCACILLHLPRFTHVRHLLPLPQLLPIAPAGAGPPSTYQKARMMVEGGEGGEND